jgi:pimeloyl-ACP methyl ester carboxylesterase
VTAEWKLVVPQEEVDDLRRRIGNTRWADDLANESWHYGANRAYLEKVLQRWAEFDWRSLEDAINAWPHRRVQYQGQTLHYVHFRNPGKRPLLLVGGWPWTFWDFKEVIPPLQPHFEVIVATLPGYPGSHPLVVPKLGFVATADLFHQLMQDLGHTRYGVYGADWGALVVEQMAHKYPQHVLGLHTSMPFPLGFEPIAPELWDAEEKEYAERTAAWWQYGTGYFQEQATKPQTVAYLEDSPAAMAAWLVEKIHGWTDHDGDVERAYPLDRILATLSLYWFTRTFGSSVRFYAESLQNPWRSSHSNTPVIAVPTAIAAFPKEVAQVPRRWAESYFNLVRYNRMNRGGHFPAVENPTALAQDLVAFFQS